MAIIQLLLLYFGLWIQVQVWPKSYRLHSCICIIQSWGVPWRFQHVLYARTATNKANEVTQNSLSKLTLLILMKLHINVIMIEISLSANSNSSFPQRVQKYRWFIGSVKEMLISEGYVSVTWFHSPTITTAFIYVLLTLGKSFRGKMEVDNPHGHHVPSIPTCKNILWFMDDLFQDSDFSSCALSLGVLNLKDVGSSNKINLSRNFAASIA